jgi:Yersinia/Haemophilus virulence surface antigen
LTGGSGSRHQIDLAKIALLAQIFGTGSGRDQEFATEAWMRSHGLVPRPRAGAGGALEFDDGVQDRPACKLDPKGLLNELNRRRTSGQYAMPLFGLVVVGEMNRLLGYMGHCLAIKLDVAGIVKFFDPNFGDFAFPTWANFTGWFEYYFTRSQYEKFMGAYTRVRYY